MKYKNIKMNKKLLPSLLAAGIVLSPFGGGTTHSLEENSMQMINPWLYEFTDEEGNSFCQRIHKEDGKFYDVSIFDKENIRTRQYGANQMVFETKFDELMENPYIWEEMQKYYPVSGFQSLEEANFFYRKYFELIKESGCGYAAATNLVFRMFEGREKDFENTFGYPMYVLKDDGEIDFNYEIFMLKFFNYSVLDIQGSTETIESSMLRDFYNYQLETYTQSEEYNRKMPDDFVSWSNEEWDEWHQFEEEKEQKFQQLFEKWKNAENQPVNLGIRLDSAFGYFSSYLETFGLSVDTTCLDYFEGYYEDDILASQNFDLYKIDSHGKMLEKYDDLDWHYVYISDILDNGTVVVSSWGNAYYFDNHDSTWTSKIYVK